MADFQANVGRSTTPSRVYCTDCGQNVGTFHHPCCKFPGVVGSGCVGSQESAALEPIPPSAESRAHILLQTQLAQTGVKADDGKSRMDLLDPVALGVLAKVLTFGANKYAAHNWRKGIKQSRLIAALLRHVFAHLGGEDNDTESGLPHIAHAMCCCMFLLGLADRKNLDDRGGA